ncbi:MAG: HD domain-containing protein [Muribaculaceae bacterium]|nr:HD domain-containing protein [Muribaculaceae bacterium]
MITPELQQYVERKILPRYDHHDAAHRRDHVDTVISQSLAIVRQLNRQGADLSEDMAYAIAAYHDTGLCEGREHHHEVSARIIRADQELRRWFDEDQIAMMADAAEDHRASAKQAPRTIYGRIVAEADRVIVPETIILRTIQYGLEHYPTLDSEGHYERTVEHLREKYGEGGYLRLWFPESPNAARLAELRRIIADPPRLRTLFDTLFTSLQSEDKSR